MRNVAVAEFKDRLSEMIAAAESGEEIVVTRHGRPTVKLVAIQDERRARQKEIAQRAYEFGQHILRTRGPTSSAEIRNWIQEDRC